MNLIFMVLLAATIFSKYKAENYYKFFKPAFSLLIILFPVLFSTSLGRLSTQLILLGLAASLVGDVFLLNHEKYFRQGLISFLLAHIFYAVSFYINIHQFSIELGLFYLIILMFTLNFFRQVLKLSIGVYIFTILLMGYLAGNYWLQSSDSIGVQIFVASILFIISDFTLAYNKFINKFSLSEFLILSTYYSAQYLFALSILK